MALSTRQRKQRRDTLIGVIGVLVLLGIPLIIAVVHELVPDLPGYVKQAPAGIFTELDWHHMLRATWPPHSNPLVPDDIKAQEGKMVMVHGFMLPLHVPGVSSEFFVAQKPRGCYFCNPPGVAEVVKVHVAGDKQMEPTDWPVKVYGKFHAASSAKDEMMYTIDDAVLMATPQ